MTITTKMNVPQAQAYQRKPLKMKVQMQNQSHQQIQPEFKINVFNYFLDDFPKTYSLSPFDTIANLKEKIINDTRIRMMDIKNFKDEKGKFVNEKSTLSKYYANNCNLNMEIYFNQDLKITTNNKKIAYFMYDSSYNKCAEIFNSIFSFHKSEKGGKIIVGVQSDGLIKGINIPEQDIFKDQFIQRFTTMSEFKNSILKDVDVSFFRVKGQNKNTYNFNDHKKIMIIKIKGKNQQQDSSSCSTEEDESHISDLRSQELNIKQSISEVSVDNYNIYNDANQQDWLSQTSTNCDSDDASPSKTDINLCVKQSLPYNLFQYHDQEYLKNFIEGLHI